MSCCISGDYLLSSKCLLLGCETANPLKLSSSKSVLLNGVSVFEEKQNQRLRHRKPVQFDRCRSGNGGENAVVTAVELNFNGMLLEDIVHYSLPKRRLFEIMFTYSKYLFLWLACRTRFLSHYSASAPQGQPEGLETYRL